MDNGSDIGQPVEWLTIREAAERVDKSTKTIRRQIHAGSIVAQRDGDSPRAPWLVSSASLAQTFQPVAEAAANVTAALSSQLSEVLSMLNDANQAATALAGEAGRYRAEAEHLRERLIETRALLRERAEERAREDDEQRDAERRDAERRRRWWRR
jgi:excisionase family DNA binding protein